MIEELQRTVITLSRENKELNERNESLRRQLMEIGAKVCNVL
jgi:transposase-like protein